MTDAQQAKLKARFLEIFADLGIVAVACRQAGVGRRTVYDWRKADPDFAAAYKDAEAEAVDNLEEEAVRRGRLGTTKVKETFELGELTKRETEQVYSDALLMFALKARDPERFRDNVKVNHAGADGGALVITHIEAARPPADG